MLAELSELQGIPAVEYTEAMFPEDADLELFESLLDATADYIDAAPESVAELSPAGGDDTINMYDDMPEDLIARKCLSF